MTTSHSQDGKKDHESSPLLQLPKRNTAVSMETRNHMNRNNYTTNKNNASTGTSRKQKKFNSTLSPTIATPPRKSRNNVSGVRTPSGSSVGSQRSLQHVMSNLSYILNADSDSDDLSDFANHSSSSQYVLPLSITQRRKKSQNNTTNWERKWIIGMFYTTTVFILITLLLRKDDYSVLRRNKRNPLASVDGSDYDVDSGNSCYPSSSFENEDIMKLKKSSTVENKKFGVVAADDARCSDVGKSILKDHGGNAVDAAISVALCLGVVNPASSGIGGGGFILIHMNNNTSNNNTTTTTEVIDCRETAPAGSSVDMYENKDPKISQRGGLSIAVPGELRGLALAHSRHGTLPWEVVVKPAWMLAKNGFHVSAKLAEEIVSQRKDIIHFEQLLKMLTKNNDGKTFLKEGDILKRPDLASTLYQVGMNGADIMYEGTVASNLAKEIQNAGGIITEEDLRNYQPVIRKPLIAKDIYGFTLVGVPPPSSGGATVIGLARIMAGFKDPFATFSKTLSKHRYIEASKNVFAIRMSLSDPDYYTNVTEAAVNDLVFTNYLDDLRRKYISDFKVQPLSHYGGKKWSQLHEGDGASEKKDMHEGDRRLHQEDQLNDATIDRELLLFNYLEDHGTSHFSIIDKDRNAVSMTTTVNTIFGSAVVSPSTGILFNDQMDDFSTPGRPNFYGLQPSKSNFISPGKRPLSSMSPTFIFHRDRDDDSNNGENDDVGTLGRLIMALGGSGGPKIITAVFQVFFNYAVLGMPLFESISHPRVHNQLLYHNQDVSGIEDSTALKGQKIAVSTRTKEALTRRGQKLLSIDYTGTVQAAVIDLETDLLTAVSDIRKGGSPAGY